MSPNTQTVPQSEKADTTAYAAAHPNLTRFPDGSLWFRETGTLWPGQAMSLEVDALLHREQTEYQDLLVFRSKTYGNVLVLDGRPWWSAAQVLECRESYHYHIPGVIQVTERDEFSYQEMIAHLPMAAHPRARHVLVIGGGDGGVLREVVKHPSVESVTLCEIDEGVPRAARRFLPGVACALDHPKVKVHIGDGFEFLKAKREAYDVIITDSSDPVGPAGMLSKSCVHASCSYVVPILTRHSHIHQESLFQPEFFELLNAALKPDGILCTQCECIWLHLDIIQSVLRKVRKLYARVDYAYTTIPTYPSGQIGMLLCGKDGARDLRTPVVKVPREEADALRYYSEDMHRAAFVLPQFARKAVDAALME